MKGNFGDKLAKLLAGTMWGIALILPIIILLPFVLLVCLCEEEAENVK